MNNFKPEYKSYRAAVDRLYPHHKRLIAVSNKVSHKDAGKAREDMEDQIDPAVYAAYPEEKLSSLLELMRIYAKHGRKVGLSFTEKNYIFHTCEISEENEEAEAEEKKDDNSMITEPAAFTYIALDERPFNPRTNFYEISSGAVPAIRMKFNAAAMNPDMCKWQTFFHELCHSAIKLHIHDYPAFQTDDKTEYDYYGAMEESVCDCYAAIHVLGMYGDAAIPFVKTYADMRLSRFLEYGHRYFTGPALHAILDQYQEGKLGDVFKDVNKIFKAALQTAEQNYVDRAAFDKSYKTIDGLLDGDLKTMFFMGDVFRAQAAMEVLEHYGHIDIEEFELEHKLDDKQREIRQILERSMRVLHKDYTEDRWKAHWDALKRTVKGPLHAIGIGPHPGY